MKLPVFFSALCLLFFYTQSCTTQNADSLVKDTVYVRHADTVYVVQPMSIFGLWIGTYNVTEGPDAGEEGYYYSLELHRDNTIQMISLGGEGVTYYGTGTWRLHSNTLTANIVTTNLTYRGTAQTVTATYDSLHHKLTGVITNDVNQYKASFNLEKVQ